MSGPFGTVYSAAAGGNWNTAATWKLDAAGTQAGFVPTGNVNTIIQGSPVVVNATARARNLTIGPAGQLTHNTGISLTVTGNMLIESSAAGTGSYIQNGTLAVTGTTQAQRWVTGNWEGGWPNTSTLWHYISSPVTSATIATFTGSLLNHWSEPLEQWVVDTLPLTLPLTPGMGFSLAKAAPDGVVTFSGGPFNNNSNYVIPVTRNSAGSFAGWNLIGNPFPCAVDWDLMTRSNVSGAVYTWSASSKNYKSYSGGVGSLTDGIIPAEQGFFVEALANPASVTIPNTARVHSATALYKNSAENVLALHVKGSTEAEDNTYIHFVPGTTAGFDAEYDAYKLFGNADAPQLYSLAASNLAINTLPDMTSQPAVALGFKPGSNGTFTITASQTETFPAGTTLLLEDILANYTQDLSLNPVYSFVASQGDPVHRFTMHFATVGLPDNQTSPVSIYSSGKSILIQVPAGTDGTYSVYDLLGKVIASGSLNGQAIHTVQLRGATGFYLVKVENDTTTKTGKVFIR